MFATPVESFRILSVECVVYSSDLPSTPLIFQHLIFLVIVENVLRTRHEYLYLRYLSSVKPQCFMKQVSSLANFENRLINHCGQLHFRVISPAPSLLRPFVVLAANFENVL